MSDNATDFLETTGDPGPTQRPGPSHFGDYRLIRQVGEDGMGEVWEAQQESPVKRRVAVKLIKAGMETWQVVSRFEAERQALASKPQ